MAGIDNLLYLGDTAYHKEKIVKQLEKWPAPEKPKGKPLGLWAGDDDLVVPGWYEDFVKAS